MSRQKQKLRQPPKRAFSRFGELELERLAQSLVDRRLCSRGILERAFMNANRNRGPRLAYMKGKSND